MSFDFLGNSFKGNDQEYTRRKKNQPHYIFHVLLLFLSYVAFLTYGGSFFSY